MTINPRDEAFFTDGEVARRLGVKEVDVALAHHPRVVLGQWPADLPGNFDHLFLRSLGLPCGDDTAEAYALLCEDGGWRVWKVSELVDRTMEALGG